MPLVLTLRQPTQIPLEVDFVRVETVRTQSLDEVKATAVQYGNKQLTVGEFFDVTGSAADDSHLVFAGDCSRVKLIGAGLTAGRITVDGSAGMHVGAEMTGGELEVRGNAGDWVGAEMKGGRIRILGSAGHCLGAVYRGGRRGMTGGEILVHGDAGNEIGHTLRRGLIAIGGKSGDAPGFNMLAGTILLCGATGIRPGAGMKRGSIVLLDGAGAPPMLPTFRKSNVYSGPFFFSLFLKYLQNAGFPLPPDSLTSSYQRYRGDFLELGRGEILIRNVAC
jgi:formylmethanofuran dehydrogenase subunit C